MASNAFSERRRRTRVHKAAHQKPQTIFLAVHRLDYSVYFKRLKPEAFAFLNALREGRSLSRAVVDAFEGSDGPDGDLLNIVQNWFENWSKLGWFCRPKSANQELSSL